VTWHRDALDVTSSFLSENLLKQLLSSPVVDKQIAMALRYQVGLVQCIVHALRLFTQWQDHMNAFGPQGFVSGG
jgi:hypothetical protein